MNIHVNALHKTFRVPVKKVGRGASLKYFFKRTYREVHAIEDLSFTIQSGELVGYLGPNGAGKSTTLKILTGIMRPDRGSVQIDGRVPYEERLAHVANIGVVFGQKSQLWWDLPLRESFELLKAIYKTPTPLYNKRYDWLIDGLNIGTYLDQPVRMLSLGQRMRAELVASLLHCPRILFLDEPTIGLDASSKLIVRQFIKTLNKDYGTTVILTTHDMDDIEALCQRVMVIDHGKLGFDGNLKTLRKRVDNQRIIEIDYRGSLNYQPHAEIALVEDSANRARFRFDPDRIAPQAVIREVSQWADIVDLLIENPPIENIIAKLYGERA